VVRLTLLGMTDGDVNEAIRSIEQSPIKEMQEQSSAVIARIREIRKAKTLHEEKQGVFLVGGPKAGGVISTTKRWLESVGLWRRCALMPGPLIRAMQGRVLTHRPLQPGSTYKHLTAAIQDAYLLSREMDEPDMELELMGSDPEAPRWGNHWARRKADKVARDTMDELNVTEGDIDDQFGWQQKRRRQQQQIHYSGKTELVRKAKTTRLL
jgi:hypothetical protein